MTTIPRRSFRLKRTFRLKAEATQISLLFILAVFGASAPAIDAQATGRMTIDFLVTNDAGEPVEELAPGEISFRVAGRDLAVHGLEMITVGQAAAIPSKDPTGATPPAFGVTQPVTQSTHRNVLLLLDEGTLFGLEKIVNESVIRLVQSLHPSDRLGLASTRPGGVNINPTTNHESVRAAIESTVLGRGNAALCVGALIEQIRGLAEALPRGRETTLALISRGSGTTGSALSQGPVLSGAGGCTFRREQLTPVEQAVSAAQINYHVFHVGGTGLSPNLDNFAGATGAETGILSWTDADAMAQAIRSSSRFYRATVDTVPKSDREYQRAELRVKRPDVKVRGPRYISNPRATPSFTDAAALIRGDVSRADLPIRVAAFASRNAGPQPIKLVVVVEPADAKTPLSSMIVSVVGADGEVAGQWTARRSDLAQRPLMTAIPVAPGKYRVRAAAADEEGRGGVASYPVTAALTGSGDVTLSAIALGVTSESGFTPRLLFSTEPEAIAYFEAYDIPASASVSAVVEAAGAHDGPAIVTVPAKITAGDGLHMIMASVPLASLPAGDSIVRARLLVDGSPVGPVVRALRKAAQ